MKKITSYYFLTDAKTSPVRDFVDSLSQKGQRKFFAKKDLVEDFGYRLPEPHAKYIGNGIFELRFRDDGDTIRVLYFFFHQDRVVFTNGFVKKTNKTPKRELKIAIERKKLYLKEQKGKKVE
ncbi:MAG: type II toxin-antitoxin system RelE/ParE family toxin [Candidatus Omnitrophica bacterium]|nr:type II toxin-antitoxin system RelE/ParE family toxin [Candidatus Omnitrophota bacterium]